MHKQTAKQNSIQMFLSLHPMSCAMLPPAVYTHPENITHPRVGGTNALRFIQQSLSLYLPIGTHPRGAQFWAIASDEPEVPSAPDLGGRGKVQESEQRAEGLCVASLPVSCVQYFPSSHTAPLVSYSIGHETFSLLNPDLLERKYN